jgi:hypothetical protein
MSCKQVEIVSSNPAFERRSFAVQRVGWCGMVGVIMLAALGLFGRGPLSARSVSDAAGDVRVDFERFLRTGAQHSWRCSIGGAGSGAQVEVNQAYLDEMEDVQITPAPVRQHAGPATVTYEFAARPGAITVEFRARPRGAGTVHCQLIVVGGEQASRSLAFSQFVYP